MTDEDRPDIPRLALNVSEACAALGVGWDFFHEHVAPELRIVRRGRRKLIAVSELQRWLDANGERAAPSPRANPRLPVEG